MNALQTYWKSVLLGAGLLCQPIPATAAAVPYPEALDNATVIESSLADINREGLVLGNGDLSGLLW
jgi:hypothetical protein